MTPDNDLPHHHHHQLKKSLVCRPLTGLARLSLSSISCLSEPSTASTSSPRSSLTTPITGVHFAIMSESPTAGEEVEAKIEELDDEDSDNQVRSDERTVSNTPDLTTPETPATLVGPVKRPRGRPRKHPLPSPDTQPKVAKGRSKTGCITCRRRKKKCDETKPQCRSGSFGFEAHLPLEISFMVP